MERIVDVKKSVTYSSEKVYLLEVFNENSGLFLHNGKVLYAEKVPVIGKSSRIDTVNLTLITSLYITPVKEDSIYISGYYNVIYFNGEPDSQFFDSFKRLCYVYSKDSLVNFEDFFYSLITIFQLPKVTHVTDIVGLFGELYFIKETWEKHSIDISDFWHIDGLNSKYDFQFGFMNIEVKSTSNESNTFNIKHSQIFNDKNNLLVLIKLIKGGIAIKELFDYYNNTSPFSTNYNFQVNLHSSFISITEQQLTLKYELSGLYIFECKKLETITDIPQVISNINYDYTFDFNNAYRLHWLVNLMLQNKGHQNV